MCNETERELLKLSISDIKVNPKDFYPEEKQNGYPSFQREMVVVWLSLKLSRLS